MDPTLRDRGRHAATLEIRFHQMDPSPAVEARIREKAAELERFSDRITGCRVVVEKEHRHHHKGNLFRVRIEIDAPGKELAVTRTGPRDHAHEDVYVAIRDAFGAAARRLEDRVRERGGKVKAHERCCTAPCAWPTARVASDSWIRHRARSTSIATAWSRAGSRPSTRAARSRFEVAERERAKAGRPPQSAS